MSDANTTKMLQAIIDGQSALREQLSAEVETVRADVRQLDAKLTDATNRIDKIGFQLAFLEDDTPTREEHRALENRVEKIEFKLAAA